MRIEWIEYRCPSCKKWIETVDTVHKCYECGTVNTIVKSLQCTICEKTVKRKNFVAGTKVICDDCKKEYRINAS